MAKKRTKKPALVLRLYVAGKATNSLRAVANAKAILDASFAADYSLETIDLLKEPMRGLADGIIVTPTLVKVSPGPIQRVIGNLGDGTQVLLTLLRN
jgi:circadian clock protein KaiB